MIYRARNINVKIASFLSVLLIISAPFSIYSSDLRFRLEENSIYNLVGSSVKTPEITQFFARTPYLNTFKGNFVEALMHKVISQQEGFRQIPLFPSGMPHQGLDGLYKGKNNLVNLFVGEAKYGSAQLIQTRSGKQMSDSWIADRLLKAGQKSRLAETYIERYLEQDANNITTIGTRLTRFVAKTDGSLNFSVKDMRTGETITSYKGLYSNAPKNLRKAIEEAARDTIKHEASRKGIPVGDVKIDNRFFETLAKKADDLTPYELAKGNLFQNFQTGVQFGAAADLIIQIIRVKGDLSKIDYREIVSVGAISGVSSAAGGFVADYFSGSQFAGHLGGATAITVSQLLNYLRHHDTRSLVLGLSGSLSGIALTASLGLGLTSALGMGVAAAPVIAISLRERYIQSYVKSLNTGLSRSTYGALFSGVDAYFALKGDNIARLALSGSRLTLEAANALEHLYILHQIRNQNPVFQFLGIQSLPKPSSVLAVSTKWFENINMAYLAMMSVYDMYDLVKNPYGKDTLSGFWTILVFSKSLIAVASLANSYYIATYCAHTGLIGYFSTLIYGTPTTIFSGPLAAAGTIINPIVTVVAVVLILNLTYNVISAKFEESMNLRRINMEIGRLKKRY